MIPHRHLRQFLPTTRLLSRILPIVILVACSSKPAEETGEDTTVVASTPIATQPLEEKKSTPPPVDGEWDGSLNYVLDVAEGTIENKDIVVVIATSKDDGHRLFKEANVDSEILYNINQPMVLLMLDTVMTYSEGVVMVDDCFTETIWYHVQVKDKSTQQVYDGWIPDAPGVYSVDHTKVGDMPYHFDGIKDSLWLGSMNYMELDLRFVNKEYDPATADNCREINALFFYSDNKIYFVNGEVEDNWYEPSFNTSQTHLAIVRETADKVVVTPNDAGVQLSFPSKPGSGVDIIAQDGRLILNK